MGRPIVQTRLSSPSPFRAGATVHALRVATGSRHDHLERALDLLGPGGSPDRYGRFLRASLAVIEAVEAPMVEALGALVAAPDRTRAERLRDDLSGLGLSAAVPPAAEGPAMAGVADALGAAYVLQGSLLGGRLIVDGLRRRFPLPAASTTYLEMYGDRTGARWRDLGVAVDAFGATATAGEQERLLKAAQSTFDAFAAAAGREGLG